MAVSTYQSAATTAVETPATHKWLVAAAEAGNSWPNLVRKELSSAHNDDPPDGNLKC
jgi:hypothetical protein